MNYKKFYLLSMLIVVLASVYPLFMGAITLHSYMNNGFIHVTDYQKYIIPYTPICMALILSTILLPVIFKLCKRYTLPAVSLLGITVFLISEYFFEQIQIIGGTTEMPLESWQYSLCIATPEVLRSIGKPIYASGNPAYKIHFYIISIVIILSVLNVIYSFSKMYRVRDFSKKRFVIAQVISVTIFIGLCILACFTAFYRNGSIRISPRSAGLMSVFFIIFGITAGIYIGSQLHFKSKLLSLIIPAITASLITFLMYIGELLLMGGVLFRYGKGFFFEPISIIPFSAADIAIILAAGVITYLVMKFLNSAPTSEKST